MESFALKSLKIYRNKKNSHYNISEMKNFDNETIISIIKMDVMLNDKNITNIIFTTKNDNYEVQYYFIPEEKWENINNIDDNTFKNITEKLDIIVQSIKDHIKKIEK